MDKACAPSFLLFLRTNAVGLQRAEPESWLTQAGVAGLNRNTFPVATYGGGNGTLVDSYERPQRVIIQEI